jgi:trans-2,3-dihydro-3-hydroxyanthranilate isomerase
MRSFPYVQTSVFVDDRFSFSGNQLATFWDLESNKPLTQEEMQGIALELNFSETTFLVDKESKLADAKVRIFTPGMEIPFAGHPTLGTAFVMVHKQLVASGRTDLTLELGVGDIQVEVLAKDTISMTQPTPVFMTEYKETESLARAIGLDESAISTETPMQWISTGFPFLIVPITSIEEVQRSVPNPALILETLKSLPSQEILIFATDTVFDDSHVHARMFAPGAGVLEDPATGSAAGPLGAYLSKYRFFEDEKEFVIEQGHEMKRPSRLVVNVEGLGDHMTVKVSGKVKLMAAGDFYLE